jgi:hypothetical protein
MKLFKLWIICVLLIGTILGSCKKNQVTKLPLPKLKSVSSLDLASMSDSFEIKYNTNGTIAQVDFASSSKPSTFMTYEYLKGKLTTLKHYQEGSNSTKALLAEISVNYIDDKLESLIIEGKGIYATTSASYQFNYIDSTFTFNEILINTLPKATVNKLQTDENGEHHEGKNPLFGLLIVKPYFYYVSNTSGLRTYIGYRFDVKTFLMASNKLKDNDNRIYTYIFNSYNLPEKQTIVAGGSALETIINTFTYY